MVDVSRITFDDRLAEVVGRLAPAEQRIARFISVEKEKIVLGSAAQIAEFAKASDATVLRTVRALGYESLAALREDVLRDLTGAASPADRLAQTLDEIDSAPARVLAHVIDVHEGALSALARPEFAYALGRAIELIAKAGNRHVFGVGPSGAIAGYLALQLNRIGLRSQAITATGVALADQLMCIGERDMVVMLAYAPLYREVRLVLDRAEQRSAPVVLISDSLGPRIGGRVAEVLAVPRGRADHLSMHGGTMVLIEALVLGLAAREPDRAVAALDDLSNLRGMIDADWRKRGTRRPRDTKNAPGG